MARNFQPTAAGVSLLLPYVNNIMGAIEQGLTRAQIWQEVQAAEAEGGPQIAGATIFDMNEVYSRARGVLNAQDAFGAVNPGDVIDASATSWAPWAAQTTAAWANPQYAVRYEWLGEAPDGTPVSRWFQSDWTGTLDVTAGDVTSFLQDAAQLSLDSYQPAQLATLGLPQGVSLGGIGRVQIMRF
jgi:hypothetical protein